MDAPVESETAAAQQGPAQDEWGLGPGQVVDVPTEWSGEGVVSRLVHGTLVVGIAGEPEIFRSVWKYFKRNKSAVADYVRACDQPEDDAPPRAADAGRKRRRTARVPLLDFANPDNSPESLRDLVEAVPTAGLVATEDVHVRSAFTLRGRPGFLFIPNPFVSPDAEARWTKRLAHDYAQGPDSERNCIDGKEVSALETRLRWATLGFHYDWKNRQYTEERQSPFPAELAQLARDLTAGVGQSIQPETAIINYYRKGMTMGGHKDDAEWTDEAPVVSISFGNAGVYVLGGNSFTDAGPPAPLPLLVRSGDVVLLGGPSRMNLHGVPCLLKDTVPRPLEEALARTEGGVAQRLVDFMRDTRINVNVRQVRPHLALLRRALPRVP